MFDKLLDMLQCKGDIAVFIIKPDEHQCTFYCRNKHRRYLLAVNFTGDFEWKLIWVRGGVFRTFRLMQSPSQLKRTNILHQISTFDRSNLVSTSKRYLHKWPQNTPFLPAPPAKQVISSTSPSHLTQFCHKSPFHHLKPPSRLPCPPDLKFTSLFAWIE